ncbi:MAG: SpoIID/LytB domain-containing protein [Caldilineaceae bacterium]
MYQLDESKGGAKGSPPVPCMKDDPIIKISFGCTAKTGDNSYAYPFNDSTITISIDGVNGPDNAQYAVPYVWDVVAREYGLNGSQGSKPVAGVKAQAIAVRTYLYERMLRNWPADNSASGFQVFMPYAYEDGGGDRLHRSTLIDATSDRYFMTPGQDNPDTADYDESIYPIPAFFGADNLITTTHGTREGPYTGGALVNYVRSVQDSINGDYGCWI